MLFSSAVFIMLFLPVVLLGFQLASRIGRVAEVTWLFASSLFFYAYWDARYLAVLLGSILMNHMFAGLIAGRQDEEDTNVWLAVAIVANVALLVWFKYLFAVLGFLQLFAGSMPGWVAVTLPLGISFFTFTQIAYLIDLSQGAAKRERLHSYGLFVTFFPHLIAGPILHHGEMMPQFEERRRRGLDADDMALGMTWFVLGLSKKVLIADRFGPIADALYARPAALDSTATWIGVLSYALQLYFDFSGYSDMALGLARMFSIRFPVNFNSPYKSRTIIEFWSRWHMTLTRYLTAYLYNPISLRINRWRMARGLKVSKKATATPSGFFQLVATPTLLTMSLAGIWHGAGLQFFVFGVLHGLYLTANHAWRIFTAERPGWQRLLPWALGFPLTAAAVLVGQVFFRVASVPDAITVLGRLLGAGGGGTLARSEAAHAISISEQFLIRPSYAAVCLLLGFLITWFMPNCQQILGQAPHESRRNPRVARWLEWRAGPVWLAVAAVLLTLCLFLLSASSGFLYFQF